MRRKALVFGLSALTIFLSRHALADCWRLPNGQVISTHANSSPPVARAQRIDCPSALQLKENFLKQPVAPAPANEPRMSGDPCDAYYGKGYCTDYIGQRIGKRPRGDPRTWPLNRDVSQIRDGVAVVFAGLTSSGHVAYVESVIRDNKGNPVALKVSEMNYAKGTKAGTPPSCLVTPNFGNITQRTFSLAGSGASGFWP